MTSPRMEPSKQPTTAAIKFSGKRLALAFAMAAISDAIGAFATPLPPIVWVVDLVTALLLFLVLGRQWLCCQDWLWRQFRVLECFRSGCWWLERLLSWALLDRRLNGGESPSQSASNEVSGRWATFSSGWASERRRKALGRSPLSVGVGLSRSLSVFWLPC